MPVIYIIYIPNGIHQVTSTRKQLKHKELNYVQSEYKYNTASWSLNCHALDDDYTNKGAGVSSSDFNIGITSTTETQGIELSFDYVQSEYNSPHILNSTHFTIWQSLSTVRIDLLSSSRDSFLHGFS